MDTAEFLRVVWPAQGPYCVGEVRPRHDGQGTYWKHYTFDTIAQAALKLVEIAERTDAYFALHAIIAKTIEGAMKGVRAGPNMREVQCFYGDLDVGEGKDYPTRRAAVEALHAFCTTAKLPFPMTVMSGRGVHVYWLLTRPISTAEWKVVADKLKALAAAFGLKWDPSVPADVARVLRPVGTWNRKDKANPIQVELRGPVPDRIDPDHFASWVTTALGLAAPTAAPVDGLAHDFSASPKLKDVRTVCASFDVLAGRSAHATNPEWYYLMGLMAYVHDGDPKAHKLAAMYQPPAGQPGYSQEKTQAALDRWRALTGPPKCAKVHELLGAAAPCAKCSLRVLESSPIKHARAIPPELPDGVPQPGRPFARTKGGITHTITQDGVPLVDLILPYDLYPTMIVDEHAHQTRAVEWTLIIPDSPRVPGKTVTFRMKAGDWNDERALLLGLANAGGFPDKRHAKKLGDYMSHYIRMLQKHQGEQQQHEHFGVTADRKGFVLPDGVITVTGETPARLSPALANAANAIRKGGTREAQIAAYAFYDHACYRPQQFVVLAGLASILMHMTTYPGAMVNFAGESGVSKTTSLIGTAAHWGSPKAFILNGNPTGTSLKMRLERSRLLSSLPFCMDEITLQSDEDIKQLALNSTQEANPGRLVQNGREKIVIETPKGNLLVTTSNRSLHDHMARHNQSGTATSMRALDVPARGVVADVHTKLVGGQRMTDQTHGEAFVRALMLNHGWTGPEFARYVMAHHAEVDAMVQAAIAEVGTLTGSAVAERFWVAVIAVTIVAARLAKALGLVPYDPEALLEWATTDLMTSMRGDVGEAYEQPIDMLQDYIGAISSNTLIVGGHLSGAGRFTVNVIQEPHGHGGLLARKELNSPVIQIAAEGFRQYLRNKSVAPGVAIAQLTKDGVLTREKVSLGRGTQFQGGGQQWALRVKLDHPQLQGAEPVEDNVVKLRAG